MPLDADDNSPEAISLSSGSHPLSCSSQDDSHPSVIAPPRSSINGTRTTADGASSSAIKSGCTMLTESISPEIELQASNPLPRFMNSSSSFEAEKKEIDSKISNFKPNNNFKSSPAKPEFEIETPSKTNSCVKQKTLGLSMKNIKRKHSPSVEELTSSSKRPRIEEKMPPVSMIPLSQLKSETLSPVLSRTKTRRRQTNVHATHDNNDSENLSACEMSKLNDVSSNVRPKSLKSFVHSSPTSSQEASRSHNNGTLLLPSRTLSAESHKRNIEQHLTEIVPGKSGCELATFENPDVRRFATPCNRPPTCADLLVLETRAQKRRSLVPFRDVLKTNTKAISRRKTLMSAELNSEVDLCNDSVTNYLSPSKVILQRLPGAWNQSMSINSESPSSVSRKTLSENVGIELNAKSELNAVVSLNAKKHKTDVGKNVSNGINTALSPSVNQPNKVFRKSRSNTVNTMASPATKQPKSDAGKNESCGVNAVVRKGVGRSKGDSLNPGTSSAEKERSNIEGRTRKPSKQKKMKKSSSTSSTSSNESVGRSSLPSIVITSLHRK